VAPDALLDLIYNEVLLREARGEKPQVEEYQRRFPDLATQIRDHFEVHQLLNADSLMDASGRAPDALATAACPIQPLSKPPPAGAAEVPAIPGYEILDVLGKGGMGLVYKARHLTLKRTVALKVIRDSKHADRETVVRFRREAEAAARLLHPNIVQIYEVGEYEGCPYLSLEYVEGGSLASRLDGTPLPPRLAAVLMQTLARAVQEAHHRHIVHRDLKPANILIADCGAQNADAKTTDPAVLVRSGLQSAIRNPQSAIKITDFGLAKQLDDDSGQTQTGVLLGTPSYMAPEQATGNNKAVGPAADIHALGVILYELLTGRPPFRAASILDTVHQVRSQEPVAPSRLQPGVPRDLETICLKCLQKEPAKRYPSAAALADDLERFLEGKPIQARPVGALARTLKWTRRRPALAALVAVTVLAGVAFWIWGLVYSFQIAAASQAVSEAQQEADAEARKAKNAREAAGKAQTEIQASHYLRDLAFAQRELAADRVDKAETLLDACAVDLRRWEWHHLKSCCRSELLTFLADPDGVSALAFSADGKRLACGGGHYTRSDTPSAVKVFDTATGKLLLAMQGTHSGTVEGVAFSPDGKRIASASTGLDFARLRRGDLKALSSTRGEVFLWDAETGQKLFRWPGCNTVAFSRDGAYLAAPGLNRTITVWDTRTGKEFATVSGHIGKVRSLAFSADGKRLAAASFVLLPAGGGMLQLKRDFKLWDLSTRSEVTAELRGNPGQVVRLDWSPDGRFLATAAGNSVRLWDLTTGEEHCALASPAPFVEIRFSPDSKLLATADLTLGAVKVWDVATGRGLHTLPGLSGSLTCVAFAGGPTRLLARGSRDGRVTLWDLAATPNPLFLPGHATPVTSVAFTRDSRHLATTSPDKQTVIVWDTRTGAPVHRLKCYAFQVAFSRDGRLLACASGDPVHADREGTIRIWDLETQRELALLRGGKHSRYITAVAFSPDGKLLASASGDFRNPRLDAQSGEVRVWDVDTGEEVAFHKPSKGYITALTFSPDGSSLALAGSDASVTLCAPATLRRLRTFHGHTRYVMSVAFSPNGGRLASGSAAGVVIVWDTTTTRESLRFQADSRPLTGLAFSPDGERLATASFDVTATGTLKLHDARNGREIISLPGQACVAFSPDGRYLAAAGVGDAVQAGGAKLWKAVPRP
jgi:WD40 repeat protein/serine/threonine protein kinase